MRNSFKPGSAQADSPKFLHPTESSAGQPPRPVRCRPPGSMPSLALVDFVAPHDVKRSLQFLRNHESPGCHKSRLPYLRQTGRSTAGQRTCAACAPFRLAAGQRLHLRIERLDQCMQLRPWRDTVDHRKGNVAPCQLLLGGVFEVGKALLHDRPCWNESAVIVSGPAEDRNGFRKNKSVLPKVTMKSGIHSGSRHGSRSHLPFKMALGLHKTLHFFIKTTDTLPESNANY